MGGERERKIKYQKEKDVKWKGENRIGKREEIKKTMLHKKDTGRCNSLGKGRLKDKVSKGEVKEGKKEKTEEDREKKEPVENSAERDRSR